MPTIQTELRVQIEGGQAPVLVRRQPVQVQSCEQISLMVDGVKPEAKPAAAAAAPAAAAAQGAKAKTAKRARKPQKRIAQATYSPTFKNVKFVAIYDAGQANGLRIKVGGAKFVTLEQPLIFSDSAAGRFNAKSAIVLQNESALPRTAVMLVGSDLAKDDRKATVIKKAMPAAKAGAAPTTAKAKRKRAAKAKK